MAPTVTTAVSSSVSNDAKNDAEIGFIKQNGGLIQQADDLRAERVSYDDKNLYLYSQSDKVQPLLTYNFHLRLYNGTDFKRMDITVLNGTANYLTLSKNSIKSDQHPHVEVSNGIIKLTFPLEMFNGTESILMGTDMVNPQNNKTLDYITYTIFEFPRVVGDKWL